MKNFSRPKSNSTPATDINLDFGAAAGNVARVFEPGYYTKNLSGIKGGQANFLDGKP